MQFALERLQPLFPPGDEIEPVNFRVRTRDIARVFLPNPEEAPVITAQGMNVPP